MRKFMVDLFDREDGRAADWPLIADALLRAAFSVLDEIPNDRRTESLLRRVHAGAYNRLVQNEDDSARKPVAQSALQSDVDPKPGLSPDLKP